MLDTFTAEDESCIYLPDRPSRQEYLVLLRLTSGEYEAAMNQGYRKFGPLLFRTVCDGCRECRSLRIPVDRFTPDRSQRRASKRNADLLVRFAAPVVDEARLTLYNRYHASQETRKGWPPIEKTEEDYTFSFLHNPVPSIEISIWEGDLLRAVVLTDVTPTIISGVYHYHDPDLADRSLGTFAILQTLKLAEHLGKPWAYFGYYVADCASLSYKARFRPCELLGEDGVWTPLMD
ncbi:MAG: arginyltransferase [Cytophagales bacterium]|nr:arginyltransferase [Armatimonadota bacterium]